MEDNQIMKICTGVNSVREQIVPACEIDYMPAILQSTGIKSRENRVFGKFYFWYFLRKGL